MVFPWEVGRGLNTTSVLADTIPGIRVVKAFAQEQREIDRFQECNTRVLQANDRINTTWSFFGPMVTLLTDAGLLVVWIFGAWQVFQHHITVGVLTAFLAYISPLLCAVRSDDQNGFSGTAYCRERAPGV